MQGVTSPFIEEILQRLRVKLDQFIEHNERRCPDMQIYIPRAYQPFVNEILSGLNNEHLTELYNASNLLDSAFILNATASVIADRVYENIHKKKWRMMGIANREKGIIEVLQYLGFGEFNHVKGNYVVRQVSFRRCKCPIMHEYSVADYILEHGQPPITDYWGGHTKEPVDIIDLSKDLTKNTITSLFGLESLQFGPQATWISFTNNHLYDINLDPQVSKTPFAKLTNLRRLGLKWNEIVRPPVKLFSGLTNLETLYLGENKLTDLPSELFVGLPNLRLLDLNNNHFKQLPVGLFAGLTILKNLEFNWQEFTTAEKTRIQNEVVDGCIVDFGFTVSRKL